MGFFSKLFGGESTKPAKTPQKAPERIQVPQGKIAYDIEGKQSIVTYVYVGEQLARVPEGDTFWLDVVWATPEVQRIAEQWGWEPFDNSLVLVYQGVPVAGINWNVRLLHELLDMGVKVRLRARRNRGFYQPGIPNVKSRLPEESKGADQIWAWLNRHGMFRKFVYATATEASIEDGKYRVEVRMVEPKPGSKAKPRVGYFVGDKMIGFTTARSSKYGEMRELVGIPTGLCTVENGEGTSGPVRRIVFEGSPDWLQ
ncbi:hypothetical protein QJ043_06950 [Olsenella sp. YH-ols2217]|uniref:HIRAN domain-containing protein n=1 Tax=Kribbibacterium absianum TaxID=3044210 RepID=A0ABT6ZL99_9ACTN|nr:MULTISPECIES: hypothetical protein [unclassified Olsenella]MDJ1121803.1 hypothetical protein [Olsenella sp. YH-ols2216]MDJ1129811.1 hypothetical protein [Olsenella sp. YH-ols2217]